METLLIALLSGLAFVGAYHTYGRYLGSKIFRLAIESRTPARDLEDGRDYVPTGKGVVFGHHFTSIAGTGPIVGPAIAIMWGWLPALLWVVFGSIFIGAVHDFGALVVSLRNKGKTVGDIAGDVLNPRVRLLFLLIIFMALAIVLAIFGLVIASVFRQFPAAIFPCLVQIPIAVAIGAWLHRKGVGLVLPSIIALALMYLSVAYGEVGLLGAFNQILAGWSTLTWVAFLLAYSYVASVLPVWLLLQPRDYINSLQLVSVLGLLMVGIAVAGVIGGLSLDPDAGRVPLEIAAPAINPNPAGAPILFPFLFITIACGAISGFHCLVSSGTSSKQLASEPDARFVGYGAMLTEGFLATLVILICAAAIGLGVVAEGGGILTGEAAWQARYASWNAGLRPLVATYVEGAANLLASIGLPRAFAVALMGVFVASFAATTLDTACRLQRYIVQELARALQPREGRLALVRAACDGLSTVHGATLVAVLTAIAMAAMPQAGQPWSWATAGTGGLTLWPLFGATNQLLGGLSFLVVVFYFRRRGSPVWMFAVPMVFMLIMPMWAMGWQTFIGDPDNPSWLSQGNALLVAIALATIALEVWMIVEAMLLFPKVRAVTGNEAGPATDSARA
ncbi:MAG: carbon starvation CstA family protein [Opitutales bacterium]